MPRFYFDLDEGDGLRRDEEGTDLPDLRSAQHEATDTLTQIGKDSFGRVQAGALRIEIRDESNAIFMTLRLEFSVKEQD